MKQVAKCKKCGRSLKSPLSIAMGMGPKCAGVSITTGNKLSLGVRRSSGRNYRSANSGKSQMIGMVFHVPEKRLTRREHVRRQREERRRLFEARQSFQCGMLAGEKTPLIYEPAGEKDWKDKANGKNISHERLQDYLIRYRFI